MMKNQKGVTLIALVITIIVLLILAGVSIAMLTGDNGILTQANKAKEDTNNAEIVERINLELNALYSTVLESATKDVFDVTPSTGDVAKAQKNLPSGYTVEATEGNKKITISYNGKSGSVTITAPGKATLVAAEK